jgi:hypothetical protein
VFAIVASYWLSYVFLSVRNEKNKQQQQQTHLFEDGFHPKTATMTMKSKDEKVGSGNNNDNDDNDSHIDNSDKTTKTMASLTTKRSSTTTASDTLSRTSGSNSSSSSSGSTTTSSNSKHANSNLDANRTSRAIIYGRVIFFVTLVVVATILGWSAYYLLSSQETTMASTKFIVINERALHSAVEIAYRKFLGGQAMAAVISQALPDAQPWPFVDMKGFNTIVDHVVPTSLSKGLNFAPIVLPSQALEWENYTQTLYQDYFGDDIEPKPGVSDFGFGIWSVDSTIDTNTTPDQRFHDISGDVSSDWSSPNSILVPKMHHAFWNSPLLLFQCHYPKVHGTAIDSVIACSEQRAAQAAGAANGTLPSNLSDDNCGTISEFSYSNTPELGPGGFMVIPIYPANDPTTVRIVTFLSCA